MTENKPEKAKALFNNNFCCAQAVFSVFAPELGLNEALALRLAEGFGAGMSLPGVCGAVSGAVLTAGLSQGRECAADETAKQNTRVMIKTFYQRFREKHGSLECKTLTGCDVTDDADSYRAEMDGVFDDVCPRLIASAVSIMEELLARPPRSPKPI